MRKKFITFIIITLFLVTTSTTTAYQQTNRIQSPTISSEPESSSPILNSITLEDFITTLHQHIQQLPLNSKIKFLLTYSIKKGYHDLEQLGLTPKTTLTETQQLLLEYPLGGIQARARFFIINVYPDTVTILTSIPPNIVNLSEENTTLEILIKITPFLDYIQTEQRIILRKLYQSTSLLWPAIGGRIQEGNTTKFILVFGPGIRWDWRLL